MADSETSQKVMENTLRHGDFGDVMNHFSVVPETNAIPATVVSKMRPAMPLIFSRTQSWGTSLTLLLHNGSEVEEMQRLKVVREDGTLGGL